MKKILKSNFAIAIYALFTSLFFTFTVKSGSIIFWNGKRKAVIGLGVFLVSCVFYYLVVHRIEARYKTGFFLLMFIVCGFFSFASVMGVFYASGERNGARIDFGDVFGGGCGSVLKFAIVFVGGVIFFYLLAACLGVLRAYLQNHSRWKETFKRMDSFMMEKNSFLKNGIFIAAFWIPQFAVRYPGVTVVDSITCLYQYYGMASYTTQHPIIYTQLLGRFADLGSRMGSVSAGLFLLILLQGGVLLLVLSYLLDTLKKFGAPGWLRWISLVLFAVAPVYAGYATVFLIDIFYCAFILLLVIELIWYLFQPEHYISSWKHPVLTMLAVLGMFFRHNGIYVVAVTVLFIGLRESYLLIRRKQKIQVTALILAVLLIPLCAGKVNESVLYKKYNVSHTSARAMLAVPLQQIGRYMLNNSEDLTEEEIQDIQAVMSYTPLEYGEKYRPYNMDGVKWGFKNDASKEDMQQFWKAWFRLLKKHPGTFIGATLNQNYCLFSPLADNIKYYDSTKEKLAEIDAVDFSEVYEKINSEGILKKLLRVYYKKFSDIPLVGFYVNQGIMDFLLLAICIYSLFDKNGKLLLAALPMLLTLAVTFVGPAAMGHPRYTFPIIYSMSLLVGLFLNGKDSGKKQCSTIERT